MSTGVGTATTMKSASASAAGSLLTIEHRRRLEIRGRHFAGGIDVAAIRFDLGHRQIEPDGAEFLAELDRERQPDVTQTYNGNDSHDGSAFLIIVG